MQRIFLYGTLRRGASRDVLEHYEGAVFVARARVRGWLYDFDDFPGLRLDAGGDAVLGEVFDATPAALAELDAWEDIDPDRPDEGGYRRVRAEAEFPDGRRESVWAYEVAERLVAGRPLIRSGDWLAHTGLSAPGE